MFVDKEKDQPQNKIQPSPDNGDDQKRNVLLFGGFALFLLVMIIFAFSIIYINSKDQDNGGSAGEQEENSTSTKETGKLGGGLPEEAEDAVNGMEEGLLSDVEAESLYYGDFYEKKETSLGSSTLETYELPINTKIDVANYHDVSRKIDLSGEVEQLNNNGFAKLDNPFADDADNFYSLYRKLNTQEIPPFITSDFLLYYYQNMLKKQFKEIEHSIFYDNVWEINKQLYTVAKARYESRRKEVGVVNDPLLEASRRELAFFAVTLKLLEPTEDQIKEKGEADEEVKKFTQQEAYDHSLELPDYLKTDVLEEAELIREGKRKEDSPVMLYYRDYREEFRVPEEYQDTSRLKNFYLASQWLNSNFPLYHRTEECPECLLDQEDWRISMITSFLIAKDFSDDQVLQNKWARIYKIISFFRGLREDLTYLDYKEALEEVKGEDVDFAEVFADYETADETLFELQEELEEYDFAGIEGGYDTDSTSTMPRQGLKVLTEGYWPSDYIFEQLTYPDVREYRGSGEREPENANNVTACELEDRYHRCRGFAYDVMNLIEPYKTVEKDPYFVENTAYSNYDEQEEKLKDQLERFNNYTWYSRDFWSLMSLVNNYLQQAETDRPAFMKSDKWYERKMDASLGAFTNLQLDMDVFRIFNREADDTGGRIGGGVKISEYGYVEPDLSLINELISNSEMIFEMFDSLKITDETASIKDDMQRMIKRQKRIKAIIKKELRGETLDEDDHEFLHEFTFQYQVDRKADKTKEIEFGHPRGTLLESINGVDLLLVVYKKDRKKFLVAGPIFDHREDVK
jgi:hypothetical protein